MCGHGGTNVIHYIGVTSMRDPQLACAGAVSLHPARAGGRHRVRRDQRGVLGPPRAGAAQLRARRRAAAALSRAARGRRRRLRRGRRRAPARRHARAGDRSVGRDRGRGLHHHRRPAARLWRRLPPADPRQPQPPGRADPGGAVRGRHDGGDPAQRRRRATARPACRPASWCGSPRPASSRCIPFPRGFARV